MQAELSGRRCHVLIARMSTTDDLVQDTSTMLSGLIGLALIHVQVMMIAYWFFVQRNAGCFVHGMMNCDYSDGCYRV